MNSYGRPGIVWTGSEYGVVWWHRDHAVWENDRIFFTRLDSIGRSLQGDTPVCSDHIQGGRVAIAWSGTEYAVVWSSQSYPETRYSLYFARIGANGLPVSSPVLITGPTDSIIYTPAIAWNGREYLVTAPIGSWPDSPSYLFRLAPDGTELAPSVPRPELGYVSSIIWTGGQYGVLSAVYGDPEGALLFTALDEFGVPLSEPVVVDAQGGFGAIGWSDARFGIAWPNPIDAKEQVFFRVLDADGNPISEISQITDEFEPTQSVQVGSCGGEFALQMYYRTRDTLDLDEVRFQRVGLDGTPIGTHLRVSAAETYTNVAAIVWSGEEYLLMRYLSDGPIYVSRVACSCVDQDGDLVTNCSGDCDDSDSSIFPGTSDRCNGVDDNCDGTIDEAPSGIDADSDGVAGACDNCPLLYNADQRNEDGDALGNACDNCLFFANDDQQDTDGDARGDACDNCPWSYNPPQDDLDRDQVGDVCDNCIPTRNESQHDFDSDGEGDECDLDDGIVIFRPIGRPRVRWQNDPAYQSYNLYRGSLAVLHATGVYTQEPGSNAYAQRFCGLTTTYQDDGLIPTVGEAFYWLVAGRGISGEEPLGDGAGVDRPNEHPCP